MFSASRQMQLMPFGQHNSFIFKDMHYYKPKLRLHTKLCTWFSLRCTSYDIIYTFTNHYSRKFAMIAKRSQQINAAISIHFYSSRQLLHFLQSYMISEMQQSYSFTYQQSFSRLVRCVIRLPAYIYFIATKMCIVCYCIIFYSYYD